MFDFEEFSEMVERNCFNSWRSVLGVLDDAETVIKESDSILFTRKDKGDKWEFSFSLRRLGVWVQVIKAIEPFEYDLLNPSDPLNVEANMSPQNRASILATDLLTELAQKNREKVWALKTCAKK